MGKMVLIEIEGGAWGGRHVRGAGFIKDSEKYLEANLLGWRIIRLTYNLITTENLQRIKKYIDELPSSDVGH